MIEYLKEIWRFRHIPATQVAVDLKRGVRDMRLGPIWWVLDPLMLMLVYYFVIQIIFHRGGPNYAVFLLAGLVPWYWFAQSLSRCTKSIRKNKGLVTKQKIPLFSLQLGSIMVNFVYMIFGLIIVILFAKRVPGLELIYLVPLFVAQGLFTLGLGSILAVINVFVPDMSQTLPVIIRLGRYLSPVLFSASRILDSPHVPDWAKQVYLLNPFATFLPKYRDILIKGHVPDLSVVGLWLIASAVLTIIGLFLMKSTEGRVLKFV
jgi:ABC-type polysaccharide/polyol phosphate export permease